MLTKISLGATIQTNFIRCLRGRVQFPIGGIAHELLLREVGFGEIPRPTVIVWMKEDVVLYTHSVCLFML